jgi:hypothetical protein
LLRRPESLGVPVWQLEKLLVGLCSHGPRKAEAVKQDRRRNRFELEALEPRCLLSGGAVGAVVSPLATQALLLVGSEEQPQSPATPSDLPAAYDPAGQVGSILPADQGTNVAPVTPQAEGGTTVPNDAPGSVQNTNAQTADGSSAPNPISNSSTPASDAAPASNGSDNQATISQQLTETLKAAQGPPGESGGSAEPLNVTLSGVPTWQEQGPGPMTKGQDQMPGPPADPTQSNPVVGAVQAIAASPGNKDLVYVGTANGGVWRTITATSGFPIWKPVTEQFPSLSIGAITFDLSDPSVVYAGTGSFSSSGISGSSGVLLKATNAGTPNEAWTVLHIPGLDGHRITGIVANGAVILVSTDASAHSLYRSGDGGAHFEDISQKAGTGFPLAGVTDLISVPGSANTLYAGVPGRGVYRSDNGGQLWTKINTGITATDVSASIRVKLAAGTNMVYAGFVEYNAIVAVSNGTAAQPGNGNVLAGLYVTGTGANPTWNAIALPGTPMPDGIAGPTAAQDYTGIHPGGQGDTHFSMVVDPNNSNIVYVGGDRQAVTGASNRAGFIGVNDWFGRVFQGTYIPATKTASWIQIVGKDIAATGEGAGGTAPHADSRVMVFDATKGTILEGDDGGINRLVKPAGPGRQWQSMVPFNPATSGPAANTALHIGELYSIAYDTVNNRLIGGFQDVGVGIQNAGGGDDWTAIDLGDGMIVAVDLTAVDAAGKVKPIYYWSGPSLGFFSTWQDTNGDGISQTA